ncbi:hypothetical protein KHA80_05060 [Anaerobacillus sp. HL2]|nr:hypothetical protein KHA80_05060 [Anaerobacillus sp. HL2]
MMIYLISHLMYESLEQMSEITALASLYRETLQIAKLPNTATSYVTNIIVSIFLFLCGFIMLVRVRT